MSDDLGNVPPADSLEVRERLVEALKLDLVGPCPGHPLAKERLPGNERPSNWYLTGFLVPSGTPPEQAADLDEDDDLSTEVPDSTDPLEEAQEDGRAAKRSYFASSIGISFMLPAEAREVEVLVTWGDYLLSPQTIDQPETDWQRCPREARLKVEPKPSEDPIVYSLPDSGGLQLNTVTRVITSTELHDRLPPNTRSVSIFLVNHRTRIEAKDAVPDPAFAFQPEIRVTSPVPFVPRPDLRGGTAGDWDDRVADLHYADTPEYAVGHGVSAEWEIVDGRCNEIRTAWIPSAVVEKTSTTQVPGVELAMPALGRLADGPAAVAALQPLVDQYRAWIETQKTGVVSLPGRRRETAEVLLLHAENAAARIQRGIELLAADADALDAFRIANRAVARALQKRLQIDTPRWRAFQLAFILLNLPGLADPSEPNRETVDLLFFPTGGGKTEAYLGLAAFAMVLRRLRNPQDDGKAGAGVCVIMRYTLRLLTLDQLGRAAGLVCALELERSEAPERLGQWPFEIGLWVGKAATPNYLGQKGEKGHDSARAKVRHYKANPQGKPSPIPLENCPWCGTRFKAESFTLLPDEDKPTELQVVCSNFDCDFTRDRALPIVAVDEQLYRRLPAFLIATVDKFAALPWTGESGLLLGGAERADKNGFYGPTAPRFGRRLTKPLPPPDLIIQDELHLISGPLGTIAGLYETAIEALCAHRSGSSPRLRPKIVASTATVRQAQDQIQALFGRDQTQIFPPPGPDRRDSFFAQTRPANETPGRLYLGVAVKGRNPKVMMRKTWLAIMGAAQRAFVDAGGTRNPNNPADPYMTLLGYFNSLRELGGARRIIEEQIQNTLKSYGQRKRIGEKEGVFSDRKTFRDVVELTSRVSTDQVADARRRLGESFLDSKQCVDCAIATNMISVGLDITRLGLMVVFGQPKTHAEYIQATSRVGRDDRRPGLVVTLLNMNRPRDRSHYERFRHYHQTFYRAVEVSSVTPFSARALDRAFAGAMVGLARHVDPRLTPSDGASAIAEARSELESRLLEVFLDRVGQQRWGGAGEQEQEVRRSVQNRVADLLDTWQSLWEEAHKVGPGLKYSKGEGSTGQPLLHEILEVGLDPQRHKFRANRSMRDVEPEVNLFLKDLNGSAKEAGR